MNMGNSPIKSTEKAALWVAVVLTLVWAIGIAIVVIVYPSVAREISYDQSLSALVVVGLFLPLALIWMAALMARSLSSMRSEAQYLRQSVEKMRKTLEIQVAEESETRDRWIQSQLAQITALTKQTDSRVSALAEKTLDDRGQVPVPRNTTALHFQSPTVSDEAQSTLPLPNELSASNAPITIRELIKALNFPDDAQDTEGFRVLRRAFKDRTTATLLQSAQDVLTMLSEDGIYMDDLRVENPAPSAWRSFAKGVRGKDVAALGMVRDRTALSLSKTRLRNDSAFRETVHRFLIRFDVILTDFESTAEDT